MESETVFTPDHLDEIGFKKSRSYDLEGLPGASDAIFGFWRIASGDPIDYEVRFTRTTQTRWNWGRLLRRKVQDRTRF